MVSFKIRFGDDIRRISIDKSDSFKGLIGQLRKLFNVGADEDIVLKYVDDEGDKVTLSSDLEFKEAVHCCKEPIQIFVSKCPRAADSVQGTLENLDLSFSRLLIVEQDTLRDSEKKKEEEAVRLERERQIFLRRQLEQRQQEELSRLKQGQKKQEELKIIEEQRKQEEQRRQEELRRLEKELKFRKELEEKKRKEEEERQEEEKRILEQRRLREQKRQEEQRIEEQKQQEELKRQEEQKQIEEEKRIVEQKRQEEQKRIEEEKRQEEQKRQEEEKQIEEQKRQEEKKERERIERRKLNDNCAPKKAARLAWVEYKARNGKTVLLDLSSEALARFGVQTYARVNTPAGAATVIGVDQEHGYCWFQLDKDFKDGLSYWDDITDYDSMICKGIVPTGDSAYKQFIPVPKETDGLLQGIQNPTERDALLQAIQESLLDEKQKEIQEYYNKLKLDQQ